MKYILLTASVILLAGAFAGCSEQSDITGTPTDGASDQFADNGGDKSSRHVSLPRRGMALRLRGVGHAYDGMVPDIDGDGEDDPAMCFDVDLFDETGRQIGTATDCLSFITPVGDGLSIWGTTIFHLPNGTFISRGHTTVQPLTTDGDSPATHITGSIPHDGDNNVLSGTRRYRHFDAEVRLSGAVNMSEVDAGIIVFDCIFLVSPN